MNPETMTIREGDEDVATHEETIAVADQDFPVPDDAMAVRMQVGDMPLTVVGWITAPESLPFLLRSVANEHEKIMEEWNAATPSAGESAEPSEDRR